MKQNSKLNREYKIAFSLGFFQQYLNAVKRNATTDKRRHCKNEREKLETIVQKPRITQVWGKTKQKENSVHSWVVSQRYEISAFMKNKVSKSIRKNRKLDRKNINLRSLLSSSSHLSTLSKVVRREIS